MIHHTPAGDWQQSDPWNLNRLAWARLAAGDEEGCRTICRSLYARFGNLERNRNAYTLSVMLGQHMQPLVPGSLVVEEVVQQDAASHILAITNTACLLPDSGIDPGILVQLAAHGSVTNPVSAVHHSAYGAALYRAGKYTEAVKELGQSIQLEKQGVPNWRKLFLAMAYHRLGKADKSHEWLGKAKLDDNAGWEQRLIYRRLRQEAEELLKSPPKTDR